MALTVVILSLLASSCSKYKYETVKGDPMNTRIYTLPNGLKVYMSVNKETPRIQTYIAVRVGGKNDPAETTGLAHYFEHLMFKGTPNFGTSDYAAENRCSTRSNSSSRPIARPRMRPSAPPSTTVSTRSATRLRNSPFRTSTTS